LAKLKKNYGKWVPYVGHRADLDHILNEMVSESNAGHTYVNWGDFENVNRIDGGLLGAVLEPDKNAE
jgi:tricorn protease